MVKKTVWRMLWIFLRFVPVYFRRQFLFFNAHRSFFRLSSPRSFSEKVNWRILRDRRSILSWTCDKIEMKSHISQLKTTVSIPRTLWCGVDLAELANFSFPERWILKANHRSQCVYIGEGHKNVEDLRAITRGWLDEKEWHLLGEWAYSKATPSIVLEEWIGDGAVPPTDYKFYTFGDSVGMILATQGRFHDEKTVIYDREWKSLSIAKGPSAWAGELTRPQHLDEMVAIAETIGNEFDFMRIDLFDTDAGVYFGETTPYPGGGLTAFDPRVFDRRLGDMWSLPKLHD